jgi:hypothetical protein
MLTRGAPYKHDDGYAYAGYVHLILGPLERCFSATQHMRRAPCLNVLEKRTPCPTARGGIEPSRAGSWLGSSKLAKIEPSPSSACSWKNTAKGARGSAREARGSLVRLDEPPTYPPKNPHSVPLVTLTPPKITFSSPRPRPRPCRRRPPLQRPSPPPASSSSFPFHGDGATEAPGPGLIPAAVVPDLGLVDGDLRPPVRPPALWPPLRRRRWCPAPPTDQRLQLQQSTEQVSPPRVPGMPLFWKSEVVMHRCTANC